MSHRSNPSSTAGPLAAAVSSGLAAILGGIVLVGGLLLLDVHGLRTLAEGDGWIRPLMQLGGLVGSFGLIGFAVGPVLAATGKEKRRR
jgi:hypothetical protein